MVRNKRKPIPEVGVKPAEKELPPERVVRMPEISFIKRRLPGEPDQGPWR